jgi:hypothetical protein
MAGSLRSAVKAEQDLQAAALRRWGRLLRVMIASLFVEKPYFDAEAVTQLLSR